MNEFQSFRCVFRFGGCGACFFKKRVLLLEVSAYYSLFQLCTEIGVDGMNIKYLSPA